MKTSDKVIITDGIYTGVEAIITGFEHLNIRDDITTINDDPKECSRVELQFKFILHCQDLVKDNKLYFAVKDFDLI